ncbi:MAG: hypothetical protein U0169_11270 [Polyangiaceae bacterium]
MERDREFESWMDTYAAGSTVDPLPADTIAEKATVLAKAESREWTWNAVATAFAFGAFATLVVVTRSAYFAAFTAFALPVLGGSFLVHGILHRTLPGRPEGSMKEHVERALARARVRLRMARVNVVSLSVLTLAFWGWYPFFALSKADKFAAQPWRPVVGVVTAIVVFTFAFRTVLDHAKKRRAEWESWRATARSIDPGLLLP